MFQDALKNALAGNKDLVARADAPAPAAPESAGPALPDPAGSEWVALLPDAPAGASLGRLDQETAVALKALKRAGRNREAQALAAARDSFKKTREKAAWKAIKERWAELEYPEKLYRRAKSEAASKKHRLDIEKLLARLHTRKAPTMKLAGADALWTWLTGA